MQLIPAIDIAGGRCVRLFQGDFSQSTHYEPTPAALLGSYGALGARWVHIVDLDGARDGLRSQHSLITASLPLTSIHVQVGGGVRSGADIEHLLSAGVARVVIGSTALDRPRDVIRWIQEFGAQRICLAFDVRSAGRVPEVRTRGWAIASGVSLWEALAPYRHHACHVLCTDIARDGTLLGPNVALYREAVTRFPQLSWQASGGVRNAGDLQALSEAGVSAAISGKALLEQRIPLTELQPYLPDASSPASTFATARS
ncbi:MAG: 1-(5-phosphoribosyl)-5-[(5-phosphoribosylamino)methylideneamino] imidazole-4-carboxamide isomerase [Proteobacteria bacterium]|nr:1-(5-phosphoribosyl)-5-[(5-phosphoribosylamino)methylideneamino] imidazole-4-carboxamide isomerase [Pseudomonadota bacterium]